jgi:predicted amidohydrolase
MKIGLAQMNSQDNKEDNLKSAEALIDEMAAMGAELIVLPEYFLYLGPDDGVRSNAEPVTGTSLNRIRQKAIDHKIYVHAGSFPELDGETIYNTSIVFNPEGGVIAKYRKIHMFDVKLPGGTAVSESETMTPGSEVVTVGIDRINMGLTICYDLRFPELFRRLALAGAQLIVVPSAFTMETGRDHWQLLLRARAVENLCWIAAPAQCGTAPPDQSTYGRSMLVNPWGLVVAQASDYVTCVVADLDIDLLQRIRTSFPALSHVRHDLFSL